MKKLMIASVFIALAAIASAYDYSTADEFVHSFADECMNMGGPFGFDDNPMICNGSPVVSITGSPALDASDNIRESTDNGFEFAGDRRWQRFYFNLNGVNVSDIHKIRWMWEGRFRHAQADASWYVYDFNSGAWELLEFDSTAPTSDVTKIYVRVFNNKYLDANLNIYFMVFYDSTRFDNIETDYTRFDFITWSDILCTPDIYGLVCA